MQALVVVDAQNEFSPEGQRAVPRHAQALEVIRQRAADARREGRPIAWVRHYNTPEENSASGKPAFVRGTWGAEFSPGLGPLPERVEEAELTKEVYGAFTGTDLGAWLRAQGSDDILLVGFYTHMCVSTTAREALMRGLRVAIDPDGVGTVALSHPLLGEVSADEVHRTALLELQSMGASVTPRVTVAESVR